MRKRTGIVIEVVPHDLALIVDVISYSSQSIGDIDGGEGIRRRLGSDKGTEQDTQGQHGRQQRAVHGRPS
jgi:hypothetical protein